MSPRKAQRWEAFVKFLIGGYSTWARTFSYTFLGEIGLGIFLLTNFKALDFFFLHSKKSYVTSLLRNALTVFLVYGLVLVGEGYYKHYPFVEVLKNFVFNCYALYLVVGVAVGTAMAGSFQRFLVKLAWIHGIYGVLYVTVFANIQAWIPGTPGVQWVGQPVGSALCIMALLAYERNIDRKIIPLLLNLLTIGGVQVRSEWLGLLVAFATWSFLAKRMKQFFIVLCVIASIAAMGVFFDVRIKGGRGGEISVQAIAGRAISTINREWARKLWPAGADATAGTAEWRKKWWKEIWKSVNYSDQQTFFMGHGYGFEITSVVDYVEPGIRTPHNIFFAALCYGGWVGVVAFVLLQGGIVICLWRIYEMTGDAFGIAFWIISLTNALLGNILETSFGAVPFYLIVGLIIAPLFSRQAIVAFAYPQLGFDVIGYDPGADYGGAMAPDGMQSPRGVGY